MTEVDFHVKVPDVAQYACRILRIAHSKGARVTVYDNSLPALKKFDELLWAFSPLDFIPHVMATDPLAAQTPIVLANAAEQFDQHQILLNLSDHIPLGFGSFERLIEFVPTEGEALQLARERYKTYRDRGYPLKTHEYREPGR